MSLDELIGNQNLKNRISSIAERRKFSHCYLITGPAGSGKHTLARLFAAAVQCQKEANMPCMECPQCRKVLKGIHPDLIYVDDTDHKEIPIKLVRTIVADAYVKPNEGYKKIYVFEHAEKLSVGDQNALLKLLEEPPSHALFLLLIPNANLLLATIRSRCPELALNPLPVSTLMNELKHRFPGHTDSEYRQASDSGFLGIALNELETPPDHTLRDQFSAVYACHDSLGLLTLFTSLERMPRDKLQQQLFDIRSFLIDTLCVRFGRTAHSDLQTLLCENRSAAELLAAADILQEAINEINSNVSTAAICAALAVKLS